MDKNKVAELVKLLSGLEPGFYPYEVFKQFARLNTLSIVEIVPLRFNKSKVEVLLLRRDEEDEFWPGLLHTPGCVVRSSDIRNGKNLALRRVLKDELNDLEVSSPIFVSHQYRVSERGSESAQIFWVEVFGEYSVGKFYDIESLPADLVEGQKGFIKESARQFKVIKTNTDFERD